MAAAALSTLAERHQESYPMKKYSGVAEDEERPRATIAALRNTIANKNKVLERIRRNAPVPVRTVNT